MNEGLGASPGGIFLTSCDQIQAGAILAQTVYDDDGRVLLRRGIRLTDNHLQLLRRRGITSLYVTDREIDTVPSELVSQQVRADAVRTLRAAFTSAKAGAAFRAADVRRVVTQVMDDLLAQPFAVQALVDVRSHEGYVFAHSLMVCALSVLMGMTLAYRPDQLFELAMGALLHDIGKARIPTSVLNKPGALDDDEWALVRVHPAEGFEVLRATPGVPLPAAHVAYQHHERLDGSGYPR
ncbi:MAG TPA: HD domain-containing phosphohydrolase, partial [Bacillota bacterium]